MRHIQNASKYLSRLAACLLVVLFLAPAGVAFATIYTAGSLLQIGDVQSKHILDGTILNADINSAAAISGLKIAGGGAGGAVMYSGSSQLASSTSFRYGTSTNTLSIIGGTIAATSTSFNGVNFTWPSADGTSGQALTTTGSGGFQFTSIGGKFGGDSSDGALSISSGTTTTALGSASVVIKNYSSISITGTAALAFSGANTAGSVVVLKSAGNCTFTSSSLVMIYAIGIGATGGAGGTGGTGTGITGTVGQGYAWKTTGGTGGIGANGGGGTGGAAASTEALPTYSPTINKYRDVFVGGGGGGGGQANNNPAGAGGVGGGGLIIECAGNLNFTTGGISAAGQTGLDGTVGQTGGGGGGGGGFVVILYNGLTANTGTVSVAGGVGGHSSGTNTQCGGGGGGSQTAGANGTCSISGISGGTGGAGVSYVGKNNDF